MKPLPRPMTFSEWIQWMTVNNWQAFVGPEPVKPAPAPQRPRL